MEAERERRRRKVLKAMCGYEAREEQQELARDESHYSISSNILPPLGARSHHRRAKLRWFIVSPYDRRYR